MKYLLSIYADRKKKVPFKCSCGTLKPTVTGTAVSFCGLIVHIHIIKVNTDMKYLLSIYADRKKKVHFKCSCGTLKPTVKCIHRNCCQFLWFNCSHTHIQSKYWYEISLVYICRWGKKGYLKILIRSLWYYHGLSSQNIKTFHPHKDQNTVKLSQLNKM